MEHIYTDLFLRVWAAKVDGRLNWRTASTPSSTTISPSSPSNISQSL